MAAHQSRRARRQPDQGSRAAPHAVGHGGLQRCDSRSTRGARTRPASGSTSRTTSTSPSGATRASAARSTSRRAGRWACDGRLEWREWETPEGNKRQAVEVVADTVQFLGSRGEGDGSGGGYIPADAPRRRPAGDFPTSADRRRHPVLGGPRWLRRQQPRKRPAPGATGGRRKSCHFCKDKVAEVDYKNINQLRRYISEKGKIRNRRITGACRRHQRQVAVAVKRAREMALLPVRAGVAMEVILRSDVEKLGLQGRGRRRQARAMPATSCCRASSPRSRRPAGSPRSGGSRTDRARHEARSAEQAAEIADDAGEDRAPLRGEGRADGRALRLGDADRHRRGALADAEDPRRPAQDRPRRDQARSAASPCRCTCSRASPPR